MFKDEPIEYLAGFREFLLEQQQSKEEPAVMALIDEIDRELKKRVEQTT